MKINLLISLSFYLFINIFFLADLKSQINNTIVVKIGNSIITSVDIENEIITNLTINKIEITQANINNYKNIALKNLINNSIKKNEVEKYEITKYNKEDLKSYIDKIAQNLNTNTLGLKEIFKSLGISYDTLAKKHTTELLWNTLIYSLYSNQININIVDVNNEIKVMEEKDSEFDIKKIKKKIVSKKKEEKLNLFSRSHFSNLENTVQIEFK